MTRSVPSVTPVEELYTYADVEDAWHAATRNMRPEDAKAIWANPGITNESGIVGRAKAIRRRMIQMETEAATSGVMFRKNGSLMHHPV